MTCSRVKSSRWNRSPQFRFTNRNKRGLAINLKDKQGQQVIRELAAQFLVFLEEIGWHVRQGDGRISRQMDLFDTKWMMRVIKEWIDDHDGALPYPAPEG